MKKKYNFWKRGLSRSLVEQIEKLRPDSVEFNIQHNLYITCTIRKGNEIAHGISICSVLDEFDEKEGKNRAAGRAVRAMKTKKSGDFKRNSLKDLPPTWTLRQAFRFLQIPVYFKSQYEVVK